MACVRPANNRYWRPEYSHAEQAHCSLPQNSYDARYLVERLDVGSGAALAHSFVKNPLRKAKSSIAVIAHKLDDKVPDPAYLWDVNPDLDPSRDPFTS